MLTRQQAVAYATIVRTAIRKGSSWDNESPVPEEWERGTLADMRAWFSEATSVETLQVSVDESGKIVDAWEPGSREVSHRGNAILLAGSEVSIEGQVVHLSTRSAVRVYSFGVKSVVTFYRRMN